MVGSDQQIVSVWKLSQIRQMRNRLRTSWVETEDEIKGRRKDDEGRDNEEMQAGDMPAEIDRPQMAQIEGKTHKVGMIRGGREQEKDTRTTQYQRRLN